MAKLPMDLGKFAKISSSDKKTTLKHKDGHFMVIAHGSLDGPTRKALDALPFAKGGKVRQSNPKLEESKKTPKMADGGQVDTQTPPKQESQDQPPFTKEQEAAMNQEHKEFLNTKESSSYAKGGEVERLFGERGDPGKNSKKGIAQMQALIRLAAKRYGMEVVPSKGKIDEETGERKDFDPKQVGGKLKPDWRSGELESQMNPQAIAHELAHLEIAEAGTSLANIQRAMDQDFREKASQFGARQKQTQGEIQPMAMENPLRRRAGVPAFARPQYNDPTMGKGKEPITEHSPERTALDTGEKYAIRLRDPDTGETYDLIGRSANLNPANLERLQAVDEGSMKWHPKKGWQKVSTPNALINLRGRGQEEEAMARALEMGIQKGKKPAKNMAEGGEVRAYAEGTEEPIEPNPEPTIPPMETEVITNPPSFTPPHAEMGGEPVTGAPDAAAVEALPDANAPTPEQSAAPQEKAPAQAPSPEPSISQQILGHRNEVAQDLMTGQIHPKTYAQLFGDKGTLGKIGTVFGLLLSGVGSGLSHQPNALMQMMDKQIERDLDAQKTSATNRQNFYKIAQQQVLNDATVKKIAADTGMTKAQAQGLILDNAKKGIDLDQTRKALGYTDDTPTPAEDLHARTIAKHNTELSVMHDIDRNNQKLPEGSPVRQAADAALGTYAKKKLTQDHPADAKAVEDAYNAEDSNVDPSHTYSILQPDALKRSIGLKGVSAVNQDNLTKQMGQARQIEKVLNGPKGDGVGGIHEILHDMYDDIGQGSFMGGLEQRMKASASSIPYIGRGIEGLGNVVFQGEGYKEYTQKAAALKQDIAAALHGLVIPSDLDAMIDPLLPTVGDTRQDIARKEQQIVQTILKSLPHDELDKWKLTKPEYR